MRRLSGRLRRDLPLVSGATTATDEHVQLSRAGGESARECVPDRSEVSRRPRRDVHLPSAPGFEGSRLDPRRSEEHTSELQSRLHLVCRLLLEKKKLSQPALQQRVWSTHSLIT